MSEQNRIANCLETGQGDEVRCLAVQERFEPFCWGFGLGDRLWTGVLVAFLQLGVGGV